MEEKLKYFCFRTVETVAGVEEKTIIKKTKKTSFFESVGIVGFTAARKPGGLCFRVGRIRKGAMVPVFLWRTA